MRRLITVDEFAKLPDQQRDSESVGINSVSVNQPELGDSGRVIRYVFSTPAVGRDLHTVAPSAWVLDNFQKNPVFLWFHDDSAPPIGRVINIENANGILKGDVEYADAELSPFADMIYRMVKARYINAVSTSWLPLKWSFSADKARPGGIDFTKVEMLEVSQVPIPALPAAIAEARSSGIDTSPMKQWAERLLDSSDMIVMPRTELETLRRAAQMPVAAKSTPKEPAQEAELRSAVASKHKRALTRAPKVPAFQRGLYDVAQLCSLLCSLGYCHESAEYEAALEGDASEVPAMLGESLVALGEALKAMAVEEIDELLASHEGDEDDDETSVEARALSAEQRAHIAAGATPRARAWRAGIAIMRAGKALSASNSEKLEAAESHHDRAMKHSRALGEHHEAVSEHLSAAKDHHERTTQTLKQVGEHVRAAQENPDEAASHVDAAAKAHRAATGSLEKVGAAHTDIEDRHQDVGDSAHGMTRCVKSAQRCVRSVTDGAETTEPDSEGADKTEEEEKAKAEKARRLRLAKAIKLRGSAATN